jgi:nitronate monooxygenase
LVKIVNERKRKIPVLAAGGIVDGRGLIAALSLGAHGAVLGTRLWATVEANGPKAYKNAIVKADSCDDVVRTQVFDTICNSYRSTEWPVPFDSSGALRNEMTAKWDTLIPQLRYELENPSNSRDLAKEFQQGEENHRTAVACVYCGQGVGEITAVEPAYEVIKRIEQEAEDSLRSLQSAFVPFGE